MDDDDFSEPADAMNFLERYRQARGSASNSPATSPRVAPRKSPENPQSPNSPNSPSRTSKSKKVWTSVFHPLGKAPTKADRYDLGAKPSPAGESVSELHAKGAANISLDQKGED